ncbi:procathepsin L-like [Saccostrea echinata]|uniref:procathepsin L-like n=1 Tax=Saccostrea echinata TaxID=191078 RepID=UPI002A80A428|nr:procathepsin L-like [Saccostrea echinata]
MRFYVFGLLLVSLLIPCFAAISELDTEWKIYKQEYRKWYISDTEETKRREIWEENLDYINQHNVKFDKGEQSYFMGLNEFSDLSHEEFLQQFVGGFRLPDLSNPDDIPLSSGLSEGTSGLPSEIDWRKEGWVGPVGNQFACGSCWAFTATGALEGQVKNKTGKLIVLSVQQLMDCSEKWGNHGCEGGMMDLSFKYVKDVGGIESDASYPYTPREETCKFNKSAVVATVKGYIDLPKSEQKLMVAVATVGPISAAIDATQRSFQLYKGGVYDEPNCKSQVDHSLVIVGYGVLDGKKYWIAKNSWGTSWGNKGYVLLSKDKNNQCGVANSCSYPIM